MDARALAREFEKIRANSATRATRTMAETEAVGHDDDWKKGGMS